MFSRALDNDILHNLFLFHITTMFSIVNINENFKSNILSDMKNNSKNDFEMGLFIIIPIFLKWVHKNIFHLFNFYFS